ncbi:MAG TPA: 2-dehydro-3-deoxygalactonokinase [Rhizomicrobium sp.]|nr:2-dehydro-3-deoxygalactonokinase [Rhizomicrobium sp.]
MTAPAFVAGDWGTTHLRLYVCGGDGKVLESKAGPGVSAVRDDVGGAFFKLVEDWDARYGKLPAVLCGMVGSTIGWREVAYLACPARPDAIARSALCFAMDGREIAIAPGLTCRNRLLAPDMMRGEETQILGAIRCDSELAKGRHFLCMPGTHTKWVSLKDGAIEHFLTALTGEMFDILHNHSVLVNAGDTPEVVGGAEFARALEQTKMYPDAELIHLLFEVRSRQLKGELKKRDASAYLSGLIIGQDVSGAKRFFRADLEQAQNVVVIGSDKLTDLYVQALKTRDLPATRIGGEAASLAGLKALYDTLFDGASRAA